MLLRMDETCIEKELLTQVTRSLWSEQDNLLEARIISEVEEEVVL